MGARGRWVAMLAATALAAAVMVWMQGRFQQGDEKNALALAREYRSRAGVTVPEVLTRRHPGRAISWSATTVSACAQQVRVEAAVGGAREGERLVYAFGIDLNGPSLHPANELGRAALAALDEPPPAASAAAERQAPAASASAGAAP